MVAKLWAEPSETSRLVVGRLRVLKYEKVLEYRLAAQWALGVMQVLTFLQV